MVRVEASRSGGVPPALWPRYEGECHVTFCLIVTFLKFAESTQLPPKIPVRSRPRRPRPQRPAGLPAPKRLARHYILCMLDATNSAYLPVVLEIAGYAAI